MQELHVSLDPGLLIMDLGMGPGAVVKAACLERRR